jgi:hypothetical protein
MPNGKSRIEWKELVLSTISIKYKVQSTKYKVLSKKNRMVGNVLIESIFE